MNASRPKKAKKKHGKTVNFLAYLAMRCIAMIFHVFPIETNLRTARLLGSAMWFVIGRDIPLLRSLMRRSHRDQIMQNLRTAFPDDYDDKQLSAIAHASCQHLVMLLVEALFTPRLITLGTWRQRVRFNNFKDALRLMMSHRGAIFVTGHWGNWEVLGYTMATMGFDTVAVMRPLDNPYINRYLTEMRERKGLQLLYKKGASGNMAEVLDNGSALAFLADQDAGRKGLFVNFFGRKASTYKSIALLAHQFDRPIVVGYARRVHWDKFFYEMGVEDIIYPRDWAGKDDEILYTTQRFTHAIEKMVRTDPRQYLWLHRRWKTQPPANTTRRVST